MLFVLINFVIQILLVTLDKNIWINYLRASHKLFRWFSIHISFV